VSRAVPARQVSWRGLTVRVQTCRATGKVPQGRLRMTQDVVLGLPRSKRREPARPVLPGGNSVPPLVGGSVQHVDTSGVHMLGHLKDSIEFVVQGRLASRSRQRIVTRSHCKFVCTHNEYWYTSAPVQRKCANLTITGPQRGHWPSPLDRCPGYLEGVAGFFGSGRRRLSATKQAANSQGSRITKVAMAAPACKIAR
jgi:hypothetical protein